MADFACWISACESALWPAGTFARAYTANRGAPVENVIDNDPVASRVREILAYRQIWTGTAAELLRHAVERPHDADWTNGTG